MSKHDDVYLSMQQKLQIVAYAASTKEGQNLLLKRVYQSAKTRILKYLERHKIKSCYVHFTFVDSTINPVILIDQSPNSNQEMFCIKYTKYVDY